jgi:hypothetical protein
MAEKQDNRPDCVVTGNYNGQFRSVLLRGTKSKNEARGYGERKGWTFVRVIQAVALAAGIFAGVVADRAQAAEITDAQAAIIGRIAVDAVAVQKCGFPQPSDMFAGMEKSGLTIQSLTYSDGAFNPVMVRVLDAVWASYKDHPAEFCVSVASTRAR